jgi:hypothetical protein
MRKLNMYPPGNVRKLYAHFLLHAVFSMVFFLLHIQFLHAEGIPELKPSNDNVRLLINRTSDSGGGRANFAGWGNPDPYSRLYIHIQDPNTERIFIGLGLANLTSSGDSNPDFDGEFLRYRLIAPNGVIVVDRTIHIDDLNIAGTDADMFNQAKDGPSNLTGSGYTATAPFIISKDDFLAAGVLNIPGDYYIEFTEVDINENPANPDDGSPGNGAWDGFELEFFDFTVADYSAPASPVEKKGRVWSYRWEFTTTSSNIPFNGAFYVADEDEATADPTDAFITKIDFNGVGFRPYAFNLFFNSNGLQTTGSPTVDRRSLMGENAQGEPEHRTYLNDPVDISASATFGIPTVNVFFERCSDEPPYDYCFLVTLDKVGSQLDILLDFNGSGGYEPGTADIILSKKVANGEAGTEICIPWDGLDGLQNVVDPNTLNSTNVLPTYFEGIFHFPIFDAELNSSSFNITYIRPVPAGASDILLKWDDSLITDVSINGPDATSPTTCTQVNLDGCPVSSSQCTRCWTEFDYGDRATLNTFWTSLTLPLEFTIASTGYYTCEISGDDQLCPGDDGTLTATLTLLPPGANTPDDVSYAWEGPQGLIAGADGLALDITDYDPDTDAGDYTFTVYFGSNCISSCTITVTGEGEPPELSGVPANITVSCESVPAPAEPTATDNSDPDPVVELDEDQIDGDCPNEYTLIRTWTATDNCGNGATAKQTITVIDNTPPVLSGVPADVTVECDDLPGLPEVSAQDNCDENPDIELDEDRTDGDCPHRYTLIRTWTATDACGASASASQTITVQDTKGPVFDSEPAAIDPIHCNDEFPEPEVLTATDACSGTATVVVTEDEYEVNVCDGYTVTYRWTAEDACGNTSTVTQSFQVLPDDEPPTFDNLPNFGTVACNNVPPDPDFVTASDNCSTASVQLIVEPFVPDLENGYVISYKWIAADGCGLSTEATAELLVLGDTEPPTPLHEPAELEDIPCNGEFPPVEEIGATDDCSTVLVDFTAEYEENICAGYPVVYRWTFTDGVGNNSEIVRSFNVLPDEEGPVFDQSPPDIPAIPCNGILPEPGPLTATDNCGDAAVEWAYEPFDADPCNGYEVVILWTATDECLNSTTLRQTVQILPDTEAPIFDSEPAPLPDISAGTPFPAVETLTATDDCGEATVTFEILPYDAGDCDPYLVTYQWTATDECMNARVLTRSFTVTPQPAGASFCTFTQGFWGNEGGYFPHKAPENSTTGIIDHLLAEKGPLIIGRPGAILTIHATECVLALLPSAGGPDRLAAGTGHSYAGSCLAGANDLHRNGRLRNNLATNAIAFQLNIWYNEVRNGASMLNYPLTGNNPNTPQQVLNILSDPDNDYTPTIQGLLDLVNDFLGRQYPYSNSLAGSLTTSITSINEFWDECRGPVVDPCAAPAIIADHASDSERQGWASFAEGAPSSRDRQIQIRPNPAWNEVEISFTAEEEEIATIRVFSSSGELMITYDHPVVPGVNRKVIQTERYGPGVYWVSIQQEGGLMNERFVKIRP